MNRNRVVGDPNVMLSNRVKWLSANAWHIASTHKVNKNMKPFYKITMHGNLCITYLYLQGIIPTHLPHTKAPNLSKILFTIAKYIGPMLTNTTHF